MAGFIYIMSNPSFKDGLVKIGKSDRDPSIRSSELYTTGVPGSFNIEYYAFVADHNSLEMLVHKKLAQYRFNESREFFTCPVPIIIEYIREQAASDLKFEEVFYTDRVGLEAENKRLDEELRKYDSEKAEYAATAETAELLKTLDRELRQIVINEINRNNSIASSDSWYDKLFRSNEHGEYAGKLQSILLAYVSDVVDEFNKNFNGINWRNDQLKLQIVNAKRALTHLARIRLAEYYSARFNDDDRYWGILKNGKLEGPVVVIFKSGQTEQGVMVNGRRQGEFVIKNQEGRVWVANYEDDSFVSSSHLDDKDLGFHKEQANSHYSIVLRS